MGGARIKEEKIMSDAGFLSRGRKKREREDIRQYMQVLGKVTGTKWKTRDKCKNKRRPNVLEKTETTALRSIPAIALSNGVRKKSTTRKNHTSPSKGAMESDSRVDYVENMPPLINSSRPTLLSDCQHSPDLHHKHTSPTPEAVSSKTPDSNPNETAITDEVVSDDLPLSWDSIIDGSQPHTRYDISDSTLLSVMNCDTQQILAELQ